MKTLFNLMIFCLAIWGVFNIRYNEKSFYDVGRVYLKDKNINVDLSSLSKFKALFPSWVRSEYRVYIQKDSQNN